MTKNIENSATGYDVLRGRICNLSQSGKRVRRQSKEIAGALAESSLCDFVQVVDLLVEQRVEDQIRWAVYGTQNQHPEAADDLRQISASIFGVDCGDLK